MKKPRLGENKYKPMIQGFKDAIAEERKKYASDARIAAIPHYVETTSQTLIPDVMEVVRIELAEAAKATNGGSETDRPEADTQRGVGGGVYREVAP